MLYIYPTPQYPRRPLEYTFKSIYLTVNTVNVIAISALIADFYTRLGSSMPEYFTNSDLVVADGINTILSNCTYSGQLHLQNVRGYADVSLGSVPYYLMTTAQYVTALFVVEFLLVVNNLVAASMYSSGNRHLRFFGIHVPIFNILTCFSYFYCIAIVVVTWSFESNRQFFKRGLAHCADVLRQTNETQLLESEFDGTTIFTTAVYWPFAAACYSLFVFIVAAIVLACNSYDEATVLLSEADAPWEARGVMCTTSKPLLKMHTAQRNAIVEDAREALQRGQRVRIVRSYQLMTEEDFEVLVKAMRDQVAKLLKEQRFEKLKENFGDTESQIDQGGLLWRAQMMAPPLANDGGDVPMNGDEMYGGETPGGGAGGGPDEDPYYEVDFDQYFDENGRRRRDAPTGQLPLSSWASAGRNGPAGGRDDGGGGDMYPEEDFGQGDDLDYYNDDELDPGAGEAYEDDLFPDADFHDADGVEGDVFDSAGQRSRHHTHRHNPHRHRTSSRQLGRSGRDYMEEPEARRPIAAPLFDDEYGGDAFSPSEGVYGGYQEDNGADALSENYSEL